MFNGSNVRFHTFRSSAGGGLGGFLLIPGIMLIVTAVAILIWPELLAYLVAMVLLFAGIALTLWGLSMRRLTRDPGPGRPPQNPETVYYEVR